MQSPGILSWNVSGLKHKWEKSELTLNEHIKHNYIDEQFKAQDFTTKVVQEISNVDFSSQQFSV